MRPLLIVFVLIQVTLSAQQRTAQSTRKKPAPVHKDTIMDPPADPSDTLDPRDLDFRAWREFAVYNKRGRGKDRRLKLCYQLISDSAVLNHCVNDSTIRDPEVFKELFRKQEGDSIYVLLYVDAFTKYTDKLCDGGHETRLIFFKWNTRLNKARLQQRTVSSCIRAITDMSKTDVNGWDGNSPLKFRYHRGGTNFVQLMFDPANYKRGLQYIESLDDDGEG